MTAPLTEKQQAMMASLAIEVADGITALCEEVNRHEKAMNTIKQRLNLAQAKLSSFTATMKAIYGDAK